MPSNHETLATGSAGGCLSAYADGTARGGAEPSNTAQSTCIPPYNFHLLRQGIDSLYLSCPGQLSEEWEQRLIKLKQAAQSIHDSDTALGQLEIGPHLYEVRPAGSRSFKFVIQNHAYRIQLSSSASKSLPLAYVKVSSDWITKSGVNTVCAELNATLEVLGVIEGPFNVSRIDLFADFTADISLNDWDENAWVTKARSIARYTLGSLPTGWSIGMKGSISARLYDKTLEIQKSGKDYLKALWYEAGWEPEQSVFRLEFQLEREHLVSHKAKTIQQVLNRLGALWLYCCVLWLKLTIPNQDDKTQSRWPLHPVWSSLSMIEWKGSQKGISIPIREDNAPGDKSLYTRYLSCLTSYMAVNNQADPDDAAKLLHIDAKRYYGLDNLVSELDFQSAMYDKAAAKARKYNIAFGQTLERINQLLDEAARDAYSRGKDRGC